MEYMSAHIGRAVDLRIKSPSGAARLIRLRSRQLVQIAADKYDGYSDCGWPDQAEEYPVLLMISNL